MDSIPFTIGGIPYPETTYGIKVDRQGEYHAWFRDVTSPPMPSRLAAVQWLIEEIWKEIEKEYFDVKHAEDRKRWMEALDKASGEALDEDENQGMAL